MTARPSAHDWPSHGACRDHDPNLWFPRQGGSVRPAKKICRTCPVWAECLAEAMNRREQNGVWGGASESERRQFRVLAALATSGQEW